MQQQFIKSVEKFIASERMLVLLTGAGISAESGIPTYRGVEGYWTQGSRNYKPEEIGTYSFFASAPYEVWKFSLYRKTLCQNAKANKGHEAVAELEQLFGNRFGLITQNIDGLHLRAGNSEARTCQVHGHVNAVRCMEDCESKVYPYPEGITSKQRDEEIPDHEWDLLKCPDCGILLRPNVLWFDEYYNETFYKADTAVSWAKKAGMLITVGTTGMVHIPNLIANHALKKQALFMDVNIAANRFAEYAQQGGQAFQDKSGTVLPKFVAVCKAILGKH